MEILSAVWQQWGTLGLAVIVAKNLAAIDWGAMTIAILTPVLLILGRTQVRTRRLRDLHDFIMSYPATEQLAGRNPQTRNPSLEFVVSKYMSDIIWPLDWDNGEPSIVKRIESAMRSGRKVLRDGNLAMLISASGFIILSYFGFANFHQVLLHGLGLADGMAVGTDPSVIPTQPCCPPGGAFDELRIVGTLAFAGAFVAAIRIFIRSLAIFDLSAYTFLRQTIEIIASVVIVMLLFRAFPDPITPLEKLLTGPASSAPVCPSIPWIWLALAPLLGLLPESAIKFLLVRMQSVVGWVKLDDDRFNKVTRSIPLDVIDGIDYWTRFRLEECGIFDVQNLATYNPILLHVETPFNIYRSVDWVAQAQLCCILGIEKFLLLRQMNVRTIFDLERAIDFETGKTPKARGEASPDEFDLIFAGILMASTETMRDIGKIGGTQPFIRDADNKLQSASIDAYCQWASETIGKDDDKLKRCIEHLLSWISDDIHIRRLRRIWQDMSDSLGPRSTRLDNPPDPPSLRGRKAVQDEIQGAENQTSAQDAKTADSGEDPNSG
jgi:hypothetical protein